jgi:hypothetical protein
MHIIKERALIFATVEIRLIPQLVGVLDGLPTPSNTSMCFCVHCPHVIHVAIFTCCEKIYFNIVTKTSIVCNTRYQITLEVQSAILILPPRLNLGQTFILPELVVLKYLL